MGIEGSTVTFSDDTRLLVDAVIWATGFRVDHSWIDASVFDDEGRLVHRRGVTESPGLYFLGLSWQHTRGSALLGWVKDDAGAHRAGGRVLPGGASRERPPGRLRANRLS